MDNFSPETVHKMGYYVYALVNPDLDERDPRRFFYIGKGKGNRCFAHAQNQVTVLELGHVTVLELGHDPKNEIIRAIRKKTKQDPPIWIVDHGLDEEAAERLEAILIRGFYCLGNRVQGKHGEDYWVEATDLDARYANPIAESTLGACVLLVSLNGGKDLPPYPEIEDEESLSERTLGYWVISEVNAQAVDYVAGVYRELVRCVYRVRKTRTGTAVFKRFDETPPGAKRSVWRTQFEGCRDRVTEDQWLMRRIVDTEGNTLTKFANQRAWRLVGIA